MSGARNDLTPPANASASKSWFKSKASKVFSSSKKLSKSTSKSTSTSVAKNDDVGPSQHKNSSKFPLQGEPSESESTSIVATNASKSEASQRRVTSKFALHGNPSQPGGTGLVAVKSDDVSASQHKDGSRLLLQGEPSNSANVEPIVDVKKSTSRPIVELWDEAYDEMAKKDKSLVADYETQLSKSLAGAGASSAVVSSRLGKKQRCEQMQILLAKKIKEIDEGEWKLKFKDHELAVKDLVEPVVGVIDWAKDFIGTSLESSPYGSIAWAGVCVLLPVSAIFSALPLGLFAEPFSSF